MPTLLTYQFTTEPLPLQASPKTGDAHTAMLTIVAANAGTEDVTLDGVMITLPEGQKATDLTPHAGKATATWPPNWTRKQNNLPPNVFLFRPDKGYGTVGAGQALTFAIDNVEINSEPGIVDLQIAEESGGCLPPDCPTQDLSITKFPDGWGEVMFSVTPSPIVSFGTPVTLHWAGPDKASYTIRYRAKGRGKTVTGLGSRGSWPAQNDPKLKLEEDVTFYLDVVSGKYSAELPLAVEVVDSPLPTITRFEAAWTGQRNRLIFTWDTQDADACFIGNISVPTSSGDDPLTITPTADYPLRPSYTLRAQNRVGTVESKIRMVLQQEDRIPIPESLGGGLLFLLPGRKAVGAVFWEAQSDWTAWGTGRATYYEFDLATGRFGHQRRIAENYPAVQPVAVSIAPRDTRLYLIGISNPSSQQSMHFLSMFDITTPSGPMLTVPGPAGAERYMAIAASKANVLLIVNDIQKRTIELRVLDRDTLAVRKKITLDMWAIAVCVSPDGSRAFLAGTPDREASVHVIDVNGGNVLKKIPAGTECGSAVLSPETGLLLVGTADSLTVIDTLRLAVTGTFGVPYYSIALDVSSDGTEAIVASMAGGAPNAYNTVSVIDIQKRVVATTPLDLRPGYFRTTPYQSGYAVLAPDNARAFVTMSDKTVSILRPMPAGGTAAS
jgi:hypothetical protein